MKFSRRSSKCSARRRSAIELQVGALSGRDLRLRAQINVARLPEVRLQAAVGGLEEAAVVRPGEPEMACLAGACCVRNFSLEDLPLAPLLLRRVHRLCSFSRVWDTRSIAEAALARHLGYL